MPGSFEESAKAAGFAADMTNASDAAKAQASVAGLIDRAGAGSASIAGLAERASAGPRQAVRLCRPRGDGPEIELALTMKPSKVEAALADAGVENDALGVAFWDSRGVLSEFGLEFSETAAIEPSDLRKLNTLAGVAARCRPAMRAAAAAYMGSHAHGGSLLEYGACLLSAGSLEFLPFDARAMSGEISLDEALGLALAAKPAAGGRSIRDVLDAYGAADCFDFARYGRAHADGYTVSDRGALAKGQELDLSGATWEELEARAALGQPKAVLDGFAFAQAGIPPKEKAEAASVPAADRTVAAAPRTAARGGREGSRKR